MQKTALTLLLALILGMGFAQADTIYKWVDAQGNVHYSDKPQPGAQKLKLPAAQTYAAPNIAMPALPPSGNQSPAVPAVKFTLSSPTDQQTFWNVHEITVNAAVSPAFPPGASVTFHLDGQTKGPSPSLSATFQDIYRGSHTASATLTLPGGQEMNAGPVTFYVHQTSIRH